MTHPVDETRSVRVEPPLGVVEVELLRGLAGRGEVRRIWPGQPGPRSPWVPCDDGCCLVAAQRPASDLADWLRFLVRELLAPRTAAKLGRARGVGLEGGHVVQGRVVVDRGAASRIVAVSRNRVQERSAVGSQRTER